MLILVLSIPINLNVESFFLVGRGDTSPNNVSSFYLQSAEVRKYDLGKDKIMYIWVQNW